MARSIVPGLPMNDIAIAAGAAFSSTVAGFLPLPVPIEGGAEMLIGYLGQKFMPKGIGKAFMKGVFIAGLSHLIAAIVPQFAGTVGQVKPTQAQRATQVDGWPHAQWKAQAGPGIYIRRNPIIGTHTETLVAPRGTTHLTDGRVPRISLTEA